MPTWANMIPYYRSRTYPAAHTYITHMWESLPPEGRSNHTWMSARQSRIVKRLKIIHNLLPNQSNFT